LGRRSVHTILSFEQVNIVIFCWMSFGFIPKGCGLSKFFVGEATLLVFVADLVWCVFAGFLCGIDCWIGVTKIASGLLSVRRCCGVRLVGKSQLGTIPTCVSIEGCVIFVVSLWHSCPH
jgi:hypothetical protein